MKKKPAVSSKVPPWLGKLDGSESTIYLAIVDRIEAAIRSGELKVGQALPTQRRLAQVLNINVGTVTRAYAEAKQRGLVGADRRRGSFVLARAPANPVRYGTLNPEAERAPAASVIDLTTSRSASSIYIQELSRSLAELSQATGKLQFLQEYSPSVGIPEHRAAAAKWIRGGGLDPDPAQMLLCNGAQHGLAAALLAVTEPGSLVLTEELTYTGVKVLASLIGVRLHGLPMDDEGLLPEALDAICRTERPRALVCVPNLHNPTNAIMPLERRREIARIALENDLVIIEDDVYGSLLTERPTPIAALAPDHTFFVTSFSKLISPALRAGSVMVPQRLVARATAGIRGTTWMASPFMAEIASRWIVDGTADRIVADHREQFKRRQMMASSMLGSSQVRGHPCSPQLWLPLPAHWRSEEFYIQARYRGVIVMPPESFAVGHINLPHAVRLNLGAARSDEELADALRILGGLLADMPEPAHLVA